MNNKKTIGCYIAAIVFCIAGEMLFHIPMALSLTIIVILTALTYLPSLIGAKWTSALVSIAVMFLIYTTASWVIERNLPFSTQMKSTGIQSLDNMIASWINRPATRAEQKLLDLLFHKEERVDPAKVKEAFNDDPLEAARLLSQQQADGQVIRDIANPFKKPVDIAAYKLQKAEKELRDRTLTLQAMAKEAKAIQMKGTVAKELVGKKDEVIFNIGDRVALASTKTTVKGAELMVSVYKGENEVFTGNAQIFSVPYSCIKFDPVETEIIKKKPSTPIPATAPTPANNLSTAAKGGHEDVDRCTFNNGDKERYFAPNFRYTQGDKVTVVSEIGSVKYITSDGSPVVIEPGKPFTKPFSAAWGKPLIGSTGQYAQVTVFKN